MNFSSLFLKNIVYRYFINYTLPNLTVLQIHYLTVKLTVKRLTIFSQPCHKTHRTSLFLRHPH